MDENRCPECGHKMVSRVNRSSGQRFWGCSRYPLCIGTRDTDGNPSTATARSRGKVGPRADSDDGAFSTNDDVTHRMPSDRLRNRDRRRWMQ